MKTLQAFILTSMVLTISCSNEETQTYENELLNRVLAEQTYRNFKDILSINQIVEEKGRRNDDVKVLKRLNDLLRKRESLKIPHQVNQWEQSYNHDSLNDYIDYLKSVPYDVEDWQFHSDQLSQLASELENIDDRSNALKVLVVLSMVENEIFNEILSDIAYCGWFYLNFNYNHAQRLEENLKKIDLIVYPTEINLSLEKQIQYDSVQILNCKRQPVEHNLKVIGTAAYLTFESDSHQPYEFSALFKGSYDGDSTWYNQRLRKEIVIAE